MIDDRIQVIVLGTKGENIILGFNADRSIPVHREEVYLREKLGNSKRQGNLNTESPVITNKNTKIAIRL